MYLILPHLEAEFRNWKAARDIGCKDKTSYRWNAIKLSETHTALDVEDGEGLTTDELARCVNGIAI